MRIQHNIMAMSAYRNYTNNVAAMKKNLEKLSSGYKINRAGDDAAGLAISEKMRAQITGLETAQKNAKDGISLVQTAEGALTEVHDMLNRMVELATQSANGTYDNTTDRAQMQKEVNQLLSEIDRIADSSNFNGINLLDGTLGLNTDAFDVGGVAAGAGAVAGDAIASAVTYASKTANASKVHFSGSVSQQNPSFKISMGDLAFAIAGASTNKASVKVTIGAASATASFAQVAGATAGASAKNYTTADIAAGIASAFNALNTNAGVKLGGLYFTASADANGDITFTYAGASDGAGGVATDATITATMASNFNKVYGGTVTTAITPTGSSKVVQTGFADHDILNPVEAKAGSEAKRAGIDVTLSAEIFAKDGNTLTIGGKEFTIRREGSVASTATNVIDLTGLASDAASSEVLRAAVLQLASKTAGDFEIQSVKPGSGTIHLEQTVESYDGGNGKKYTYDDLTKLVSANEAGTPAKGAGTVLDIAAANVKGGNVLKIGEGSNAKTITFASTDTTASKIKAKIEAAGFVVEDVTASATDIGSGYDTRFIIRTTDAAATTGPQILGKGLTLQIGDTADSFNQLNVAVQDMHAANLGIGGLKIDTEEAAQAATDKIKAAINMVSDVRGTLGATQNRLDHTINNLSVMTENIQDAESTIRDVDVAEEMMAYTKNNILIQSAQAMLAQANQVPQGVLQLLQ